MSQIQNTISPYGQQMESAQIFQSSSFYFSLESLESPIHVCSLGVSHGFERNLYNKCFDVSSLPMVLPIFYNFSSQFPAAMES